MLYISESSEPLATPPKAKQFAHLTAEADSLESKRHSKRCTHLEGHLKVPFCLNSPIIWRPEFFPSLQICSCLLSNLFMSLAASTCPAPAALYSVYVDCPLRNQHSHVNLCTYQWDEAISRCEDSIESISPGPAGSCCGSCRGSTSNRAGGGWVG